MVPPAPVPAVIIPNGGVLRASPKITARSAEP
jgi:hypothetical protein